MIRKNDIIEKAYACGFGDIGFTTADSFDSQRELLQERQKEYAWAYQMGLDLIAGTDPKQIFQDAKSIIVLMEVYFNEAFPSSMEKHFGRCYLDDDRMAKDGLAKRIKAFRSFLKENGIESKVPFNLPHRLAAARSGMGTFGKNCLFYSNKVVCQGSWVLPVAVVVDQEFSPDEPTLRVGCPDWCKNSCISACPTGALKGPRKIDPARCISYLSYYGQGITPMELREPMGMWVYGCDHCQNVCPRNAPWLARELPVNKKVAAMLDDFKLVKLLHMDKAYFNNKVFPHMFYMSDQDLWRWKMNVARAMGNSRDEKFIPDLLTAFHNVNDEKVLGMIAWAMGRIGGPKARKALNDLLPGRDGLVREEILLALEKS
ncbi:MAG TPA: 4Fe-4S double cluster binding domain-containing protein [Thermodesulfobacteriota bacterium]|nr:4Fe-4S double cluster binding domain-containing protein [Thermodesulfobacteriota bacterium]